MGNIMGRLKLDLVEDVNASNCVLEEVELDKVTEAILNSNKILYALSLSHQFKTKDCVVAQC